VLAERENELFLAAKIGRELLEANEVRIPHMTGNMLNTLLPITQELKEQMEMQKRVADREKAQLCERMNKLWSRLSEAEQQSEAEKKQVGLSCNSVFVTVAWRCFTHKLENNHVIDCVAIQLAYIT
jgi:hypothetical protein